MELKSLEKKYKAGVGYNAQLAVDDKHHLIVEQDVTNKVTDIDELSRLSIKAKEELSVDKVKVVADAGYTNAKEIEACDKASIEAYTPRKHTSRNENRGLYTKDDFKYDKENDCYICPAGEALTRKFQYNEKRRKRRLDLIYYTTIKCNGCPEKERCTTAKIRRITRTPEDHAIDAMYERIEKNPSIMKKRKEIVEHVFGTIKFWNEQENFLMRGLEKVKAEFSLSAISYNITRVINIVGVNGMIQALN